MGWPPVSIPKIVDLRNIEGPSLRELDATVPELNAADFTSTRRWRVAVVFKGAESRAMSRSALERHLFISPRRTDEERESMK